MRCCVCGWADADTLHVLLHLQSEVAQLRTQPVKVEGDRPQMIHAILQVARGLVRPIVTLASVGAVIAAVFVGKLEAPTLLVMATACLTWWFKERSDRHKGTPTDS